MARRSLSLTSLFLASSAIAGWANAAELGEARVVSYIGQQLVADIELTALESQAAAVQVGLASLDVYRGAGLDMAPVLGSLKLSVMRREGRQFLHITSLKPVESPHLHLFLELADGGQRAVRQATLWLTPDPTPPAPPAPPVRPLEPPPPPVPVAPPAPRPAPPAAPVVPSASLTPRPIRLAALSVMQSKPAACPRQQESALAPVCAVLDTKNTALREQIVKLEGKVKLLQTAMNKPAVPAPQVAAVGAKPEAAKPVPLPPAPAAAKPVSPPPAPAAAPPAQRAQRPTMPWAWIAAAGAAVFVLVGLAVAWRNRHKNRRKEESAPPVEPAEPGLG